MGFRWPTMPGSGGAQVAQQIGAIGAGIGALGEEINAQQAEVEYQDFKLRQKARINALGDTLEQNTDENTYLSETKKVIDQMQSDMPKNGLAKRFASSWIKNEIPHLNKAANESIKRRIKDKSDVKQGELIEDAIRSGNTVDLEEHTVARVGFGYMSAADAQRVLQDTRHKAERSAAEQIALGPKPEIILDNYTTAQELQKDFPTLTPGDFQDLRSMARGQQRYLETDEKLRRREAINAVGVEASKLAATEGIEGYKKAQKLLLDNIDILGHDLFTTLSRNLQTTSKLYGETGINYYEVTHKPSVFWELDSQIKAGTLTDPAFVYQRTGADGISETDAARLAKRIPKQGGSANDFRNGAAATMFLNAYKAAVSNNLLLDEAGLGKELGLRWLEDSLQQHPDWSLRQVDEEALRIMEKVQQAEIEGALPTTADELKGLRVKAEKKTNRDIMQRIWEQMTEEERVIAMQALKQGKTAKEIIAFFEANK
ncbi:hypothetical protein LCGC14_0376690 [marine sediment metagenome]|uniref:Uncharacterized protein n=1 Tax=marine sediment metagenome TaxID=412755 RepID=A0A0F9WC91_9ZZZZ